MCFLQKEQMRIKLTSNSFKFWWATVLSWAKWWLTSQCCIYLTPITRAHASLAIYVHYGSDRKKMQMQVHRSGRLCMHSDDGYAVEKCARMMVVSSEIFKSMIGHPRIWWQWWYKVSDISPASEIVDGDIVEGGGSLDGIGFAACCSVIGC